MPLTIRYKTLDQFSFDYPYRIFVSGSSQSGKTHFAHQLLNHDHIFANKSKQIVYFHPDYLSHVPIKWHETLNIPVSYQAGLPTLQDLCALKPYTTVILDDIYEECINSTCIDYLFRVLSGKQKLSVMILSQRYFSTGKYSLNIRNNCNFTVLMRNVDFKLNMRISTVMGLKLPIEKCIDSIYENNLYPYIFIDSTPRGQVSTYRCYINIFDRFRVAYNQSGMKAYIISETDFLSNFQVITNTTAVKNGTNETHSLRGSNTKRKGEKSDSGTESEGSFTSKIRSRARKLRKRRKYAKNL